jgi:hypothetical protein
MITAASAAAPPARLAARRRAIRVQPRSAPVRLPRRAPPPQRHSIGQQAAQEGSLSPAAAQPPQPGLRHVRRGLRVALALQHTGQSPDSSLKAVLRRRGPTPAPTLYGRPARQKALGRARAAQRRLHKRALPQLEDGRKKRARCGLGREGELPPLPRRRLHTPRTRGASHPSPLPLEDTMDWLPLPPQRANALPLSSTAATILPEPQGQPPQAIMATAFSPSSLDDPSLMDCAPGNASLDAGTGSSDSPVSGSAAPAAAAPPSPSQPADAPASSSLPGGVPGAVAPPAWLGSSAQLCLPADPCDSPPMRG